MGLAEANRSLEGGGALPDGVWGEWLWDTSADEPVHAEVLLNRNQLLGLLVCRFKSRAPAREAASEDPRLTVRAPRVCRACAELTERLWCVRRA